MSTDDAKPRLLFFFTERDGHARKVDAYLAQVLQRRRNHDTFHIHRIDVTAHPELATRFRIDKTPTLCVVEGGRLAVRAHHPRGATEIKALLAPWLR
ncbi:MAG TPA: thioredoxin family protein [Gemmatimonadaceae bacterium]|nr:thioredoxin family protein [Gemmatimonadaceae bacterium]